MPQAAQRTSTSDDLRTYRLTDRYRGPFDLPVDWNDTLDTLVRHRSVRAYLPNALPFGTIELLVAAAQSAASSSNLQPWSVVAVEDPERKARLAVHAGNQKHLEQAPLLLIWLIDLHRLETIGQQRGVSTNALAFLETFLLGAVDTSLAAQNAVVAAESLGLGTVYVGGIRNRPLEVAAELDLPPHVFALFGLAVGVPDPAAPASVKPRLPQDAVLSRETYGNRAFEEPTAAYDAHMQAFQREQNLRQRAWSAQATERVAGPESMSGRDALRAQLEILGFALK
ncbi:nitroreductase [Sphingomonas vulcanisoli]|uniref:Nitroreductase n=1 Tax=Sphingomonas vulcanisoli TaxID=1658060 RepID=A0ABX0TMJ7_9SPHN|nr:NADPH-dependent oxidoreductase [Sphingomonas vulcanisoli]NIJ06751.1 nitroreductase [Sphingomonas vulcanisoli]